MSRSLRRAVSLLSLALLLAFLTSPPLDRTVRAFPESRGEGATLSAELEAKPTTPLPEAIQSRLDAPIQVVRFALYDAGIYPSESRVEQGRVVISLVDYTGGTEGLVIEREVGGTRERAGYARRAGAHWRGRQELDLSAGTYQLYDASRQENRATLVVE